MTQELSSTKGLAPGTRLGRYQVVRRLALGGMAELYLARHLGSAGFEKVIAIKRVLPHLAEDQEFVRMFLNEARIAAGLDHPNIVHVMDFGSEDGEPFMAMEYIHGRSVGDILRAAARRGPIPLECALTIVQGVAAALQYAHDRTGTDGRPLGLVHRDVSPTNVLVTFDGGVKLVDFGIAKATNSTRATRSGSLKGKLAYMAPEHARGEAIDRRADVFALGVVAYELTTGTRCFFAGGEFALLNRVAAAKFDKPTAVHADYPPDLEEIVLKALARDRDGRFATARDFQVAVERYAAAEGFSLSAVVLSDYMNELFGQIDYPTTDLLPLPEAAPRTGSTQVEPRGRTGWTLRKPKSRRNLGLAGVALAAGVAIGLGLQAVGGRASSGEDEAAKPTGGGQGPVESRVPAAAAGPPSADSRTVQPPPAASGPAPTPVPSSDEARALAVREPAVAVVQEDTDASGQARETPPPAKDNPKKSRPRRPKRKAKRPSPKKDDGGVWWRPPSQR